MYIDVHVARIQQYLDRSTRLWERRFASGAIVAATSEAKICGAVANVAPHGEAGSRDGYVNLRLVDPDGDAQAATHAVLTHLRTRLPAAHLEAWWGRAGTHAEAESAAHQAEIDPQSLSSPTTGHTVWLPAVAEIPLAKRCEACGDTATSRPATPDPDGKRRWLCSDCHNRQPGRLYRWRLPPTQSGTQNSETQDSGTQDSGTQDSDSKATAGDVPARERALLDGVPAWRALTNDQRRQQHRAFLARDFNHLHPNTASGTDDTPAGRGRHHATIQMDGNAIGQAFHRLAPEAKGGFSQHLSAAIWTALKASSDAIHVADDRRLLVQPHLLGGDDVLVTVWAPRAWDFVSRFITTFQREMATVGYALRLESTPTISAGVVIAADSYPFPQARQLAEDALGLAKRRHQRGSAIGWLDVTADGDVLTASRCVTVKQLDRLHEPLARLAGLGQSRQKALRLAANKGRLAAEANRLGETSTVAGLDDLDPLDALNLVRWWKP